MPAFAQGDQINSAVADATYTGRLRNQGLALTTITAASVSLTRASGVVLANAASNAITVTLPNPANAIGQKLMIKKTDSTANLVTIARFASETIDGTSASLYLINQNESFTLTSDGTNWFSLESAYGATKRLCRTLVSLTAVADIPLFTVPAGRTARIDKVILEGQATMSGGTSSKLKIGVTGNSFNDILGSAGITFVSATGTTLLAIGQRIDPLDVGDVPASVSVGPTGSFAAASVIQADISGTVVTAGAIYVELWGNLF